MSSRLSRDPRKKSDDEDALTRDLFELLQMGPSSKSSGDIELEPTRPHGADGGTVRPRRKPRESVDVSGGCGSSSRDRERDRDSRSNNSKKKDLMNKKLSAHSYSHSSSSSSSTSTGTDADSSAAAKRANQSITELWANLEVFGRNNLGRELLRPDSGANGNGVHFVNIESVEEREREYGSGSSSDVGGGYWVYDRLI